MIKTKRFNLFAICSFLICSVLLVTCSSSDSSEGNTSVTPEIVTTGSISAFGNTNVLNYSNSQSIQVKGENLSSNLSIVASTNFEVSLDDTNFSNSISIIKDDANTGNSFIYVRFSPTVSAIGTINGTIVLSSSQATSMTINLSGIGVSILPIINVNNNSINFGDTGVNQVSASQTLIVNGDNLNAGIDLTTSSSFEVSLDNSTFSSTVQIPTATVNNDTTIYVRFSPTSVGSTSGTLTLSNADTTDTIINLLGNAIPIIHNYIAFNQEALGFGGGFNQSSEQVFSLHSDLTNIAQIKMYLQIDCPTTGCDDWDRFANIKVKDLATGNWYEIGRYITPYWTGTQQLDRGLEFDVTDFKALLTGNVELRIYIENWTAKADLITLDFDFIEGTPDYPYYAVSEILGYHINSIDGVPYGVSHSFDLNKQVTIPANAESTHLRTLISGWGHATPNDPDGRPCAEWCYRTHNVKINGTASFQHNLNAIGCASNPISNQNPGNWQPDRAGWCPGMAVPTRLDNFSTTMAGNTFSFEYDYENWTNNNGNGNAFYATSTYVVVKSNSAITAPIVVN